MNYSDSAISRHDGDNANTSTCVKVLILFAMGAFLPTLFAPYVGEEGIFTITSLEMWYRDAWLQPMAYGGYFFRPPLYNWLIIPVAGLLGWEHVLLAARIVTAAATLGMALVLWRLVRRLTDNREFALFAVLAFFSGDILIKRGWLAYADPLFSFFTFAALAGVILAAYRRSLPLLLLALLSLTAAYLTKAFTCYLFYGAALAVLLVRGPNRDFLLRPLTIVLHLAALSLPLIWRYLVIPDLPGDNIGKVILFNLHNFDLLAYLQRLLAYPLETLLKLAPLSLLALYLYLRKPAATNGVPAAPMITLVWILGLNYLPYWLAPDGNLRYVMPLLPLFGLLSAWLIWRAGPRGVRLALYWMAGFILLRHVWGFWGLPWYQLHYRTGDYAAVAQRILARVGDHPLYILDSSTVGLTVTAELDIRRLPGEPLTRPPAAWDDGFVISERPNRKLGRIAERYPLPEQDTFLLCRGAACEIPPAGITENRLSKPGGHRADGKPVRGGE